MGGLTLQACSWTITFLECLKTAVANDLLFIGLNGKYSVYRVMPPVKMNLHLL